ncbi:hypothetical protein ACE1CD_15735 [Aerosakkonema sp. BLCC-F183]|uniref:hypothetical protein n=1 Tax=Aerosakkonema sp. BLCC-F183 TaxID=3342834 RepID=UPI0035B7FF53
MKKENALAAANLQKAQLLQECDRLLNKIANHRYSLKLLMKCKTALQIIADYKPLRNR